MVDFLQNNSGDEAGKTTSGKNSSKADYYYIQSVFTGAARQQMRSARGTRA